MGEGKRLGEGLRGKGERDKGRVKRGKGMDKGG